MSIYYDPDHWFIKELSVYFNQNPVTKEELLKEVGCETIPFVERYDPRTATEEKEKNRREKISQTLKQRPRHENSLKNIEKKDRWKGKKQPPEMIEKRRQSLMGHKVSEETRRKMSESAKRRLRGIK